jgi:hypothetical protein
MQTLQEQKSACVVLDLCSTPGSTATILAAYHLYIPTGVRLLVLR